MYICYSFFSDPTLNVDVALQTLLFVLLDFLFAALTIARIKDYGEEAIESKIFFLYQTVNLL